MVTIVIPPAILRILAVPPLRVGHLGEKPRHTWNEAVVRWLKEQAHEATASEDVAKLRWLDQFLGGKTLDSISRTLVDKITDAKLAQGLSNATVNRTLELLRAILRKCVNDWEWLDRAPPIRMLKEPTRRIRFLTQDEAQRLLAALPPHLADMAAFSLHTGLRAANVTGLQWSQVALRASGRGSLGALCGTPVCFAGRGFENSGHNLGTGPKIKRARFAASP